MTTLCICGIDTNIGKSVVTGLMARFLHEQGHKVITQKPVQTGCDGQSEDILTHRRLMETGWLEEDEQRLTCPYNFSFPGSPPLVQPPVLLIPNLTWILILQGSLLPPCSLRIGFFLPAQGTATSEKRMCSLPGW